jgi:hypothetical protein
LTGEQVSSGLIAISLGLAKKILIADTLNTMLTSSVNTTNGFSGLIPAWYLVIACAAQLYFDFSGYTDIVLGISQLFGVRLPQNFNNPYLASNPGEFWERWHMSLSVWFRTYLFSPLSRTFLRKWGSEKRDQAQYAANIVTMSLVGLWHGAGWNFIVMAVLDEIAGDNLDQGNRFERGVLATGDGNTGPTVAETVFERMEAAIKIARAAQTATDTLKIYRFDSAIAPGANLVFWDALEIEQGVGTTQQSIFCFFEKAITASLVELGDSLVEQEGVAGSCGSVRCQVNQKVPPGRGT